MEQFCHGTIAKVARKDEINDPTGNYMMSVEISDARDIAATY
jgi:hypothetical protein